jgi:hypothetical protein
MNVQPAASLPGKAKGEAKNGKMFIVNLQETPYDDEATIKVHCRTDEFMLELMRELGLEKDVELDYDLNDEIAQKEDLARTFRNRLFGFAGVSLAVACLAAIWQARSNVFIH